MALAVLGRLSLFPLKILRVLDLLLLEFFFAIEVNLNWSLLMMVFFRRGFFSVLNLWRFLLFLFVLSHHLEVCLCPGVERGLILHGLGHELGRFWLKPKRSPLGRERSSLERVLEHLLGRGFVRHAELKGIGLAKGDVGIGDRIFL
jgi:hypothetical protein